MLSRDSSIKFRNFAESWWSFEGSSQPISKARSIAAFAVFDRGKVLEKSCEISGPVIGDTLGTLPAKGLVSDRRLSLDRAWIHAPA